MRSWFVRTGRYRSCLKPASVQPRNHAVIQVKEKKSRRSEHQATRTRTQGCSRPAPWTTDGKKHHSTAHSRNRLALSPQYQKFVRARFRTERQNLQLLCLFLSSFFLHRILLRQCLLFAKFLNCLYGDSAMRRLILRYHKSWPRIFRSRSGFTCPLLEYSVRGTTQFFFLNQVLLSLRSSFGD